MTNFFDAFVKVFEEMSKLHEALRTEATRILERRYPNLKDNEFLIGPALFRRIDSVET